VLHKDQELARCVVIPEEKDADSTVLQQDRRIERAGLDTADERVGYERPIADHAVPHLLLGTSVVVIREEATELPLGRPAPVTPAVGPPAASLPRAQ
jgi:hypothetical protein